MIKDEFQRERLLAACANMRASCERILAKYGGPAFQKASPVPTATAELVKKICAKAAALSKELRAGLPPDGNTLWETLEVCRQAGADVPPLSITHFRVRRGDWHAAGFTLSIQLDSRADLLRQANAEERPGALAVLTAFLVGFVDPETMPGDGPKKSSSPDFVKSDRTDRLLAGAEEAYRLAEVRVKEISHLPGCHGRRIEAEEHLFRCSTFLEQAKRQAGK